MSLETAGEFVLAFLKDADATAKADEVYLQAVAAIAQEQGHEIDSGEVRDAMRAIAGLDADVTGYSVTDGTTLTQSTISGNTASLGETDQSTTIMGMALSGNTASISDSAGIGAMFSPLGFMR